MIIYRTLLSVLFFFILLKTGNVTAQPAWPEITHENKPWTRWWWLGNAVDKQNLTHNLETLRQGGFGGVELAFIYGVKGNENNEKEFLSPEWMDLVQHTMEEAKRLNMGVDMSNVTGWPFGGPQITSNEAASKAYFQKYNIESGQQLTEPIRIKEAVQMQIATLNCLMAYSDKGEKLNLTNKVGTNGILNWTAPAGTWNLIALFNGKTRQAVKRSAPGGEGPVMDHFSKEALDIYLKPFADAFASNGFSKPRCFFNDSYEVYGADWTASLLNEFHLRRGYRLEDYFPEFLGDGDPEITARLKSDYRETISEVVLDNFFIPWSKWTHQMGSKSRNQAHGSPGNLIDIYGAVDVPECETFGTSPFDIPGLPKDSINILKGDADPMMLKFSSSAAHLAGLKYTSSETFTWLGNHFRVSLAQCKPELDQLFLSGINHTFYHGSTYTPQEAKWPGWYFYAAVNFVPIDNIWRDVSGLNGYNARCQSFLQSGLPDNELLVYWPIYDNWHNAKGTDMPFKIHDLEVWLHPYHIYKTVSWLRQSGYDFDYISDNFLSGATVSNGKIKLKGGEYKVLVVPETSYMPLETLQKIEALAKEGAKVVFIKSLPGDVPGLANLDSRREAFNKIKEALKPVALTGSKVNKGLKKGEVAISELYPGMFKIFGVSHEAITETGASFIRRKHEEGHLYFIANQQSKPVEGWIKLGVNAKSAVIYDPMTGGHGVAKIRNGNNGTEVYLQLTYNGSLILKTWSKQDIQGNAWNYYQSIAQPVSIKGKWKLAMTNGWPEIPQDFNLETLTSWTNLENNDLKKFAGTGKYTMVFSLPDVSAENWLLDLGKVAESARVKINGHEMGIWWSIPYKAPVGQYLKAGENTLEIEVSNLSANRIADYDRRGVEWKIFKDINVVTPYYKPFNASQWDLLESGLIGPVTLTPLKRMTWETDSN